MQANIPKLHADQATVQAIDIGQVALGPITVGNLVLDGAGFSISAGQGVLTDVSVTIRIHITVEWHVHVGLPDGIPDIDIGDTYDLGTFSFGPIAVSSVTIPGLNNIQLNIPSLTAQNATVSAAPISLKLTNVVADKPEAANLSLPASGFTIAGMTVTSLQGAGVGVPAAKLDQASVDRVHGDPIRIQSLALTNLALPAAHIPAITSAAPFDIPAQLPTQSPGFDAGLLRVYLHLTPSASSHVGHLEITNASASATVKQITLSNVTLPYDALKLTLSQIGINTVLIPAFSVS